MNEISNISILGKSIHHDSSLRQATGEAKYIDDISIPKDTLHLALVLSKSATGKIKSLNIQKAMAINGVYKVLTAEDIPGKNQIGPIIHNEPALAQNRVEHIGQPIAVVIAKDHNTAQKAAKLVNVEILDDEEPIFDLKIAMKRNSLVMPKMLLKKGDALKKINNSEYVIEDEFTIGGQDHFYLEGQISLVIPDEDNKFTVWSSTQHPTEVQHCVANVLGISQAKVTSKVRRLGGGFGGKESQASIIASITALCSWYFGKPAKLRLTRHDDMLATGKRHDFLSLYKVGFNSDGRIQGLEVNLLSRAGNVADLSGPVMTRAMTHIDNCYSLKNVKINGYCCKTNTVSNTAFRGFGGPQGIITIETIIDNIARKLTKPIEEIRNINLYSKDNGLKTPYGQIVNDSDRYNKVWDRVCKISNLQKIKRNVEEYNLKQKEVGSPLRKGLSSTLIKFGISFNKTELNQAGALVHVYTDGSIRLGHGGTEMGQGLFIKIAQVVADVFSVSIDRIELATTTTSEVPNTSATAASSGSDINGMAAYDAAIKIKKRMAKVASQHFEAPINEIYFEDELIKCRNKTISFAELAQLTWSKRVSLSSTGFYKTPKIHWDQNTMKGNPFFYFTWGASISEVVIDAFTGESNVLSANIVQDCGTSLNPSIDIGQIEGAFIQGLGWLTCEELFWNDKGRLMTIGPSTYKIPGSRDIPNTLNVELLENSPNIEKTIFRSKAVGEPPLMLAISSWLAIRDAISNYRGDDIVNLNAPATPEEILKSINS